MKMTPAQTGQWFDTHLAELGISQTEFCKLFGLAGSSLSHYKNHKERPGYSALEKLCQGFDVDVITMMIALGTIDADATTTPKGEWSPKRPKGPLKSEALDALRSGTTRPKPMSDKARMDFRRQVRVAMAEKGWKGPRTCLEAGISTQTLNKVTRGQTVSGISMFKLRQALDLDKDSTAQPKQSTSYPADVELVRDSIGEYLTSLPTKERSAFLIDLFATITKRGGVAPELP